MITQVTEAKAAAAADERIRITSNIESLLVEQLPFPRSDQRQSGKTQISIGDSDSPFLGKSVYRDGGKNE
jgi:hypothetical protein